MSYNLYTNYQSNVNYSNYTSTLGDSSGGDVDNGSENAQPDQEAVAEVAQILADPGKFDGGKLHESARDEKGLIGGIHLFHGIEDALKTTFPGWPLDLTHYEAFQQNAEEVLRVTKMVNMSVQQLLQERGKYGSVATRLDTFMGASPIFGGFKQKPQYHGALLKIMARGVKYLDDNQREKYRVEIGPTLMRGGVIFDTAEVCKKKKSTSIAGSFSGGVKLLPTKRDRCMWVMALRENENEYKFYSHFGKLARFHHSSFTGGQKVRAAGEWFVERGKITLISGMSGHYRPTPEMFDNALRVLVRNGVMQDCEVQVFDKKTKQEVRIGAIDFNNRSAHHLLTHQLFV